MTPSIKKMLAVNGASLFMIVVGIVAVYMGHTKAQQAASYRVESKSLLNEQKLTKFQRQRPVYSAGETKIDDFMTGFLTFSNQKEFDSRRQSLRSIVSKSVYDNGIFFKTDKYHKVKQLSLEGTYVRSDVIPTGLAHNQLTANVYATQTLNFKGKQGKDVVKAYTVTYDGQTGKLTSVTEHGTLSVNVDSATF